MVLDGKTRGYVKPNTTQSAALSRNDSVRIARAKWLLAQRLGTSYPLYEEWTRFKSMALSKIAKILPTELDAMRDTAGLAGFYAGARSAIMLIDRVLDSADLTEEEKDAIADTILAETEEFFKDLIGPHPL